jgi:hypothetical protein
MTTVYGSKQIAITSRDVAEDEPMVPGKIYEAEYEVSGIRTIIPGWENDAINEIVNNLTNQGAEVLYVAIDAQRRNYVHVQWRYYQREGEFQATVLPLIAVYAIAFAVITICAIWLILTITGSVKEIGTAMMDNPQLALAINGLLAIGGIIVLIYFVREFKSAYDEEYPKS